MEIRETLRIDEEFEKLIPPLTDEEYRQLEENIVLEGTVLMPLMVWNGTVIDGHNRYKIIRKHPEVRYQIYEKHFDNRYEAISWICKNQLGRRNLTPKNKEYLVGRRYAAEKMSRGGDRRREKSTDQFGPFKNSHVTRKRIAEETGTSEGYVARAERFAAGLDAAEAVLPGIRGEILSGKVKPTKPEVIAIAKASPSERRQMAEGLRIPKEAKDKSTYEEIRRIAEEMTCKKPKVSEDSILASMTAAVNTMIEACELFFRDYPNLLTDQIYRGKVIRILQKPKNFILKIEGEKTV